MELGEQESSIGIVRPVNIEEEMRNAYLDYAMSVIVARALPDVRDGFKPVQRRILYAMHDMGLHSSSPYKKSARIVGEVLGKYHPHGDAPVYEAMARMAQDFTMRYPLVDGQGNFGSIDGDAPAAMRYTEARLSRLAEAMLEDIEKDTVDWMDNFDGSLKEPAVLPGKLPNLLLNGASGIAVGMATNIPPHNLNEVADAICYLIDHWGRLEDVALDELMRFIQGPDFPTGAIIVGTEGIRKAYATGNGRVVIRAVTTVEEMRGNRHRIIVHEIPFQLNKTTLIERIAELVRAGRLDAISDLRDESDREGMRIVIELKRGSSPRKVLNQLFKYTPLQTTFGVNLLALVNGEPRLLSLKRILQAYVEHRQEVITRRTKFELNRARERAHILEGLRIALQFLDEVITLIRQAESADAARTALMSRFGLTAVQAQAILDLQLRRLAALERQKIEDEYREVRTHIAYLEDLLAHPEKILALIKADLQELKEKFGDRRRTIISPEASESFTEEDLIPQEDILVSITADNYIKRTSARAYPVHGRGGRGVTGMQTRDEDQVLHLFVARTLDHILFFTNQGRVYCERAYNLPEAARNARGLPIVNVLHLNADERVTAAVAVPDFEQAQYIVLLTRQGRIKRMPLSELASVRPSGIIAMSLEEGDELGWARLTGGSDELIIVTARGRALRFPEGQVRPMGRTAGGVNAIRLQEDDWVAELDVVEPGADLLVVTAGGYGKRTPLTEYPVQSRYGSGVHTTNVNRLGDGDFVVAGRIVSEQDEVMLMTANGIALRTRVRSIHRMGRPARGVRLVHLQGGDRVTAVARLSFNGVSPEAQNEIVSPTSPSSASPAEDMQTDFSG
ncbi:MAG: DNA gyrase subunit A [Anaerolineae bacterium]|nr:DNA gyrase subunit A [Anaerolineae bacterium]MDW8099585.1 DNA gyrase subunit A [Anaerolineae bacterium]